MIKTQNTNSNLALFEDELPFEKDGSFKSECPPDKKVKIEDLFKFSRTRGDLQVSIVAAAIVIFFFVFFWSQTGWEKRVLPDRLGSYFAHQLGFIELRAASLALAAY